MAILTLFASLLLIRPIMKPNSLQVGQLFVGMPFGLLVGLMMDNFSEMAILIETQPVFFRCSPSLHPDSGRYNVPVMPQAARTADSGIVGLSRSVDDDCGCIVHAASNQMLDLIATC